MPARELRIATNHRRPFTSQASRTRLTVIAKSEPQANKTNITHAMQRRDALKAVLAGIATVGAASSPAFAGEAREGEVRHTDAEWKQILTPDQYAVLRTAATEKRFSSPLVEVSP